MKCKNCGAQLLNTDKFCDQCGWKVVKERRCPECNAPLREGTKFCPKCGMLIGGADKPDEGKVFMREAETTDIPIADIEQNILFQTEREIHRSEEDNREDRADKAGRSGKTTRVSRREQDYEMDRAPRAGRAEPDDETGKSPRAENRRPAPKKSIPAPEQKRRERPAPVKKRVYEDWDEEEDDDEEDEDEGGSLLTIVSVVMAFLILAVAAFAIFFKVRPFAPKNYGEVQQEETEIGEDEAESGSEGEGGPAEGGNGSENADKEQTVQTAGTLFVVSDVNVRDNPSTEGTNVIRVAKEGETYEYTRKTADESWYEIILEDGSIGYVFAKYVSVEN